ncbi:stage VI sporulation protein D [Virgibacillus indicus]|uniref:Stage VI sporulation protein D n=1 Tax=Virgibacillus indicus TaxID=2024554 RepID=A0A265NED1_9BACI|nr:stage VI sporulation protein D [Virgibacillus indicus]
MLKGGNHLANDQPVFSFELNEALYFEKGQEVEEMRGVSLDPDISIQSFSEYISIRGVIELRGEYLKAASSQEDPPLDFNDYQSKRYVEKVVDIEEGETEFIHRFPVEISVPAYRVNDINDVNVQIESFDYEIPEPGKFQLFSKIQIQGIQNEAEKPLDDVEDSGEKADNTPAMAREEPGDSFQFEIKQEKESPDVPQAVNPEDIPSLAPETGDESAETDRWKFKQQSKTLKEFFNELDDENHENNPPEASNEDFSLDNADEYETVDFYESEESREVESVEDVSYLSGMFRKSEEENYAQMRLCIVQDKDTIETIAERYKVTTLQLIKQNQLDEDYDVTEGQLLYIPNKK